VGDQTRVNGWQRRGASTSPAVFRRILRQLLEHWQWLALGFLCLVLTSGLSLLGPELMKRAIDSGIAYDYVRGEAVGSRSLIVWLGGLMLLVSVVRGLFGFGRQYLSEMVSQLLAFKLCMMVYDRIQRLSFECHDHAQTGQLMSRTTQDIEGVRFFVIMLAMGGFIVFWYLGIWLVLFVMHWQLALASLAVMPFVFHRAWHLGKRLEPVWDEIQDALAQMGTVLQENLTGVKVVRAFAREDYEIRKYEGRARVLFTKGVFAGRISALNTPLMTFMFSFAMAIVVMFGGVAVIDGEMTVGSLTQFAAYLTMLVWPVAMLGNVVNMLSRGLASGARILEVIDAQSKVQESEDAVELGRAKGEVRFENVIFSYAPTSALHEGPPHLGPLSFAWEAGQTVALVGATGSGKSTLVNLLPRFYDVDSGVITLDGQDVRNLTLASMRRNVGIVQQEVFLFSGSIAENIAYDASDATFDRIVAAAKAARLHEFIESLPRGYETEVGEHGSEAAIAAFAHAQHWKSKPNSVVE
jgi:ABC-type multidrug transport system fused ATPase/permease subunit